MSDQHILQETFDSLPKLDYIPLLDTILKELKTTNTPIFQLYSDQNRLLIRAYDFADKIATENKTLNPLTQTTGIRAATVNFEDAAKFCDKIRQIQQLLKEKLNLACQPESPENILVKICSDLGEFNHEKDSLPFNYDFKKQSPFTSKRLTLENSFTPNRSSGSDAIIKAHHFNIRFTGLADFQDNLCEYIRHHIETITDENSSERQDLNGLFNELLARPDSSLNNLRSIIDQEALPRLLRDLKIDYLEYLKKGWQKTHSNANSPDLTLLQTLINRLKIVIEYINDPNLDNAHYDIAYLGETLNLRTAFSQSDAFDSLPIIPDYEGVIGESYNRNSNNFKEFNLGIRLKLNGSVSAYNEKSSLDYHIAEIDPTSPRHREYLQNSNKAKSFKTRVLKNVCLYYLIFAIDETGNTPDEEYNPILQFEQEVLRGFQSHQTNPEAITQLLLTIKNKIADSAWEVNRKVNRLKSFLQDFLKQKTVLNYEQKTVKLRLHQDILHQKPIDIINSQNFFKINLEDDDTSRSRSSAREALAYLKVGENQLSQDSLASLEVTFTFDDVRYFTVEEEQKFALRYNIDGIKAPPVVFYPIERLNAEEIEKTGEKFKADPASQLTIDYQVLIHSVSDQENNEDDSTLINQMIDIIKSDILQRLNQNQGQIIVYIQNKDKLKKLIDLIAKQLPTFEAEKDYLEIHASLSEKEIANIQQFKDSVNVIFMTASASRGLSFPNTRYILVEIPGFQIEQNLMEIIQVIYRGRGGSLDQGEKFIKFYLSDKAIYFTPKVDEDNHPLSPAESQELAKISLQESCLSALNILIILKASIMTRIVGSGQIGFQSYVMIPIGGKSIKQGGDSFLGSMVTLYQELQKESEKCRQDQRLKEISQGLLNLLSAQKIEIYRPPVTSKTQQEVSYLSLGSEILSKLEKSLDQFLDLPPLEKTYVRGSLLIIPLSEKTVKEINYIDLSRIFALENSDFLKQLWGLAKGNYPKQIKTLVYSALELVYNLVEVKERSQQVIQTSKSCDRYYAFPIQTFLTFPELEEYFLSDRKLLNPSFQDISRKLVYSLSSADNILPVDGNYKNIPYVVFNTNSMDKLGKNLFNENQLFHSKEMNILNLILSQSD